MITRHLIPVSYTHLTENHPIVLVVEDNTDIREYIRSSFTELYEVITAKDGKEGWELHRHEFPTSLSVIS